MKSKVATWAMLVFCIIDTRAFTVTSVETFDDAIYYLLIWI